MRDWQPGRAQARVLHLIPNDKFFDFVHGAFSAVSSSSNRFYANPLSAAAAASPELDQRFEGIVVPGEPFPADFTQALNSGDILIVHLLNRNAERAIAAAPPGVKVVWSGWGVDYQPFIPPAAGSLLDRECEQLVRQCGHYDFRFQLEHQANPLARQLRLGLARLRGSLRAIRRVDYFSAPIPEDFVLLQASLGRNLRAHYHQLNYASVEHTFASGPDRITGSNILLGNSASPTNNHASMLHLLARHGLSAEQRVLVPLSYGPHWYRDAVIAMGRETLGEQFVPLVDFMPVEQYNGLVASCATVIMNQRRQQALGNIGAALFQGARVFLNEMSPTQDFFRSRHAVTNRISELAERPLADFSSLAASEVQANREVLDSFWGSAAVQHNIETLIERVAGPTGTVHSRADASKLGPGRSQH